MEQQKEDSKQEETQTLSEESAEKKESSEQEQGTPPKTYTEEEIAPLKKKAADFDAMIASQAEERRKKRLSDLSQHQEIKPQDDSESDEFDPRKIVREELAKAELKKAEQNFGNALDKFVRKHPEYSPENDVMDVNWKKIKLHIEELKNGIYKGSEDGYLERLELIHNGISNKPEKPESKTETVEDSGVGNITSQPKVKTEVPDAMTRPLNKWEKESAKGFPGKTTEERELGYRKKLAELEAKRKK